MTSPDDAPAPPADNSVKHLIADKFVDFLLIFVGLYAAMQVERCQAVQREKKEYVTILRDFQRELDANLAQESAIEKDLGPIEETEPGKNLGPMQETFARFFTELKKDETVVHCLHDEFVAGGIPTDEREHCHELYRAFEAAHRDARHESFAFRPAVLTPFYRNEVWQLYLADGVKVFRNKDLAVRIAEVYANAKLIEEQIKDIEATYNEAFMGQVGKTAATDMELAEIVHDEERQQRLTGGDLTLLLHVDEATKEEHYAVLETERILELKVERMKNTVLTMREEIVTVKAEIDEELERTRGLIARATGKDAHGEKK
ncbi:MAG: hypothetical protein AAGN82_15640 [Myxococcota bacterium]